MLSKYSKSFLRLNYQLQHPPAIYTHTVDTWDDCIFTYMTIVKFSWYNVEVNIAYMDAMG